MTPDQLTDGQRTALEVLAWAQANNRKTRIAATTEIRFRLTMGGYPVVCGRVARALAGHGLAAIGGRANDERVELTPAGEDLCDAAGISKEVAA